MLLIQNVQSQEAETSSTCLSDQLNRLVKFQISSYTSFGFIVFQSFRRPRFCFFTLQQDTNSMFSTILKCKKYVQTCLHKKCQIQNFTVYVVNTFKQSMPFQINFGFMMNSFGNILYKLQLPSYRSLGMGVVSTFLEECFFKILHTGDKDSLDRCGQQDRYNFGEVA